MKLHFSRFVLVAALAVSAFVFAPTAFAQEHGGEEGGEGGGTSFIGGPDWSDVKEVTIWSITGIGIFGTVLGVLYLFKRKVGGFPEHPAWVAPITIMPASELPGDGNQGHEAEPPAGHGHAPAH